MSHAALTERSIAKVGYTPLICAAVKGQSDVIKDLIKLGCDANVVDNVRLSLQAATDCYVNELMLVLCAGTQDNWTALHHAASGGDVTTVRALLEAGASRAIKNEVRSL
jgi:ankyrin repeat protein